MEIELKYLIEDEETQKKLWDPSVFGKYGEVDLHAETNMRAVYYELTLPLCEKSDAEEPSLKVFAESEKGRELIELAGERKLIPTVETSFTRRTMRIDTGKTICEAALDTGKIITSGGNADIRELELELFSGDVEDIEAIGRDLAEKFSLRPGIVSKYARGIELYQKNS